MKKYWKTAAILLIIGLALFVLLRGGKMAFNWVTVSDMLFIMGAPLFVWGMIHLVGNLHVFASLTFGVKMLKRLFFGKREDEEDPAKKKLTGNEEYLEYLNSRPHHGDVPVMLILAACLFILSALAAFMA